MGDLIESGIREAFGGLWTDATGWLVGLLPDWLVWAFSFPFVAYLALAIGLGIGYIAGRVGWLAVLTIGASLVLVWHFARRQDDEEPDDPDFSPQPTPQPQPRKRTLMDLLNRR